VAAISHSKVTEAFYIISGSGTLVTGTSVENDRAFPPETEFVRLAVGPSSAAASSRAAIAVRSRPVTSSSCLPACRMASTTSPIT
jgi:hypothetical protein